MEIAAFVVSLFAIVIAGVAAWFARREALAEEDSAREATRSADAAQEVASYQRDEVERNRVRFRLERLKDGTYFLHNDGNDSAYCVHVDSGDLGQGRSDITEFPSRHPEPYILTQVAEIQNAFVVSWHHRPDCSDERQSKRLPV